jgi:hypothetical protein
MRRVIFASYFSRLLYRVSIHPAHRHIRPASIQSQFILHPLVAQVYHSLNMAAVSDVRQKQSAVSEFLVFENKTV